MRAMVLVLLALGVAGCAPMTQAQRDARDYRRIEFQQRFIDDRARCHARGGRIYVLGYGGQIDSDGVPTTRAYYTCS